MIEKEQVLSLTENGLNIFRHYLGIDNLRCNFKNPFYDDSKASCRIFYDKDRHIYRFYDHGDPSYSGDCFWFVAKYFSLDIKKDFPLILKQVIQDLNLNSLEPKPKKKPYIPPIAVIKPLKDIAPFLTLDYKVREFPFDDNLLNYWRHYGIDKKLLLKYKVCSLASYESINSEGQPFKLIASATEPIFAYQGKGYIKLYRPNSAKLRFLYGGSKPENYCFGLEQLPNKGDILFITGGEKDVLSLSAYGFNAICFNSETAKIPKHLISSLYIRFKHIILLYDVDETGRREAEKHLKDLKEYNLLSVRLPLKGSKGEKDISDYFALGHSAEDLRSLLNETFSELYAQTLMILHSCEMDYKSPPLSSKEIVSVNDVPIGTQGNLFCITGGEGTGKSNYVSAILSGAIQEDEALSMEVTLGLEINYNPQQKAVLHYDTEQSEAQLYKNLGKSLRRAKLEEVPDFYHSLYLASLSRKERLKIIRESMDLYHHKHRGIHLVVIDGIADLIRSANDETESIAIVDELYRLAGIYNTCIICVLHFVPSGLKLRGHIGSELQRKAAGILSIENDDTPSFSVVKALKVRDGSPLDIPMMLFAWDKKEAMHVYKGVKSNEDKEKRKREDLISIVKEIFRQDNSLSYLALCEKLMTELDVKERTAKKYIAYMKKEKILCQDDKGNYKKEN